LKVDIHPTMINHYFAEFSIYIGYTQYSKDNNGYGVSNFHNLYLIHSLIKKKDEELLLLNQSLNEVKKEINENLKNKDEEILLLYQSLNEVKEEINENLKKKDEEILLLYQSLNEVKEEINENLKKKDEEIMNYLFSILILIFLYLIL